MNRASPGNLETLGLGPLRIDSLTVIVIFAKNSTRSYGIIFNKKNSLLKFRTYMKLK